MSEPADGDGDGDKGTLSRCGDETAFACLCVFLARRSVGLWGESNAEDAADAHHHRRK